MKRLFTKDQLLTIPNLLSLIRFCLIPLIIWLYCEKHNYYVAAGIIIISGITDIVDGIIARKFNMVSDFGKILDPIADKCTQAAIIICLTVKHKLLHAVIILFAIKEAILAVLGYLAINRKNSVNSAKWHGKVNTVVLYSVMILLILFPGIPENTVNVLILFAGTVMLLSLALYIKFYLRLLFCKGNTETIR